MKVLAILLISFGIVLLTLRLVKGQFEPALAGRIALAVMLLFAALGHFLFTKGMTMMLPSWVPLRRELVYCTGVLEILAAVALLIPLLQVPVAWFLIGLFLVLLPANIYSAVYHINYEAGTPDGDGLSYLWFRIPLQVLFIVWTWFSAIRPV